MKVTDNMKLRKPESEDYVKVEDFNHNADLIDTNNEEIKTEKERTKTKVKAKDIKVI